MTWALNSWCNIDLKISVLGFKNIIVTRLPCRRAPTLN